MAIYLPKAHRLQQIHTPCRSQLHSISHGECSAVDRIVHSRNSRHANVQNMRFFLSVTIFKQRAFTFRIKADKLFSAYLSNFCFLLIITCYICSTDFKIVPFCPFHFPSCISAFSEDNLLRYFPLRRLPWNPLAEHGSRLSFANFQYAVRPFEQSLLFCFR